MSSALAIDALLLFATSLAAKRRPAELSEVAAALDLVEPELPAAAELAAGFARLGESGLLLAVDGRLALAEAAEGLIGQLPRKGEHADRVRALQGLLAAQRPTAGNAIAVEAAELQAALLAQRAAVAGAAKNLLVPKPKPEAAKARPGQRQRKPLPKSKSKPRQR